MSAPPALRILEPKPRLFGPGDDRALQNLNTTELPSGALCWVSDQSALYALDRLSTDPPSGVTVVAAGSGPGRWLLVTSSEAVASPYVLVVGTQTSASVQAAVDLAIAQGKTLWVAGGDYTVSGIVISGPLQVRGDGQGVTVINQTVLAPGDGEAMFIVTSDGVSFSDLTLNGQRTLQPADGFSDSFNTGPGGTGRAYRAGILVYDADNPSASYEGLRVEDCEFTEHYGACVASMNTSGSTVRNNYCHDTNFEAWFAYDNLAADVLQPENQAIGNRVVDLDSGSSVVSPDAFVLRKWTNFVFSENKIKRVARDGAKLESCEQGCVSTNTVDTNSINDYPGLQCVGVTRGVSITNNVIRNCGAGILLGAFGNGQFTDIIISDNIVNTTTGTGSGDGIIVGGAFTGLDGLTIEGNHLTNIKRVGIHVEGGWSNVNISGNTCKSAGSAGALGIACNMNGGNWSRLSITDNLCYIPGGQIGAISIARTVAETVSDLVVEGNSAFVGSPSYFSIGATAGCVTSGIVSGNRGDGYSQFASPGLMVSEDNSFSSNAGVSGGYRFVTTDGTQMTYADNVVGVNIPGATRTLIGPAVNTSNSGRIFTIKDVRGDATANPITWTPAFGLIDGNVNAVINTNFGKLRVFTDDVNWFSV